MKTRAEYQREWVAKNPERAREIARKSWAKHKETRKAKHKLWREKNKDSIKEKKKAYRLANLQKVREGNRRYRQSPGHKEKKHRWWKGQKERLFQQILEAYGRKCACCGETQEEFLTIDHIGGRGSHHRLEVGGRVYSLLRRNGFPKDNFRLLCMNCNFSLGMKGYCPHQNKETGLFLVGVAC